MRAANPETTINTEKLRHITPEQLDALMGPRVLRNVEQMRRGRD
jgi:hypothetical protein